MKFISTRDTSIESSLETALTEGLAPDGGLYVPQTFPNLDINKFSAISDYSEFAYNLLHDFFTGSELKKNLLQYCQAAFNFPLEVSSIDDNTQCLELFHGPTLSFKDFGARFLAECVNALSEETNRVVLVATSGDTGSAVASAFYNKNNIRVVVLFPEGKITARQRHQITCWNKNIYPIAIPGVFDDCQALVKQAFQSEEWKTLHPTSANSINLGRLLPQVVYYAYASVHLNASRLIVPSGNLGNVTAAYWAQKLGFPIQKVAIACNANHVVIDYLKTGKFTPHPSIRTLANAMDIGKPSNFERLAHLFPSYDEFKQHVSALSVSDDEIKQAIVAAYDKGSLICPHTATAYFYRLQMPENEHWTIAATAHPCKFEDSLEPLLDITISVPKRLQKLLEMPEMIHQCEPKLDEIIKLLS